MMAFALIPTFVVWLITYGAVKYPAQALGRFVVRRSPNILFDICICIGVTLLCWGGVVGMMTIVYAIGQPRPPHADANRHDGSFGLGAAALCCFL